MADNTMADAPKRNAAPAEAPKSLQATIQNVMTKAVTSPTDAKIDFAQGVNHITGDPHQKSAGAADSMQSLKANNNMMKPKAETYEDKEEVKEEGDDEKKKEMMKAQADKEKEMKEGEDKEKEMKKETSHEDEKKKEVKEGEMPAGLKKYLDKKNGKEDEKSEEKEDKKDVKEAEDKEDKKDHKEEDEKKKEVKEEKDEDEKKDHKEEDEKKKEVKEEDKKDDEKEMKKETAKDKVKDMDMKEDVKALTDGEDLSEEFKAKAATIFESAVKAKLVEELEKLEGEYETKLTEKTDEVKGEIVEKVDAYLNYVVEEWMKDNELAIEKGLRTEISEDFIGGLKSLFDSHYINVPQEKYNVIENQSAEIEELKGKLNESIEQNVELSQKIGEFAKDDIVKDVASDLAETEKEKLKSLAENIEYKDAASYRNSVETLKNSYYPKAKASDESNGVAEDNQTANLSESMAAYTAAISKTKNKKLY
tara:strand:- start:629 stop:2062 length:1434 start_codon:yes stop_codon:yes gene_type:complete